MTLNALRTQLPIRLALPRCTSALIKTVAVNSTFSRSAQLNVLADEFASEVLEDLRVADKPAEFYQLPTFRVYLRDGTSRITSRERRTLTVEFPENEIRVYLQQRNHWADHIFDFINSTAYRAAISALTENVRTL
jgi:hypothetical protein